MESERERLTRRLLEIRELRKSLEERAEYRRAWIAAINRPEWTAEEILAREG